MLAGLKRFRDFEDDEGVEYSDYKKLRALPFRSSPTSQFTSLSFSNRARAIPRPHTLTAAELSEDETDYDLISPKEQTRQSSLNLYLGDVDNDVDMDISEKLDQPLWSPMPPDSAFAPSFPSSARSILTITTPLARSINTQAPRIPTPIYGHFALTNLIGDLPPASPAMPPPSYINNLSYSRTRPSIDTTSDSFLRRRALPSPISEDEHMESPTIMEHSILGNLKMNAGPLIEQISVQTLTPDTPSTRNWINMATSSPKSRRRSDAISGETEKESRDTTVTLSGHDDLDDIAY
ncbi:MAG: hypothetical protein GOMPHAMPRED_006904 [Gomphillus americanus]|uniref:Uncharacterized protein n=1 Tax=Gomphillus americanus TaxID=1940652 RepID=A0A8H3EMI5_9LECA|nr:MAG: hypothetical protein GOMPHAMPRED_006904 [Gomphillus americanus]